MICSKCNVDKSEKEFYFKSTEKRWHCYCKKCLNQFQMERWKQRKIDAVAYKGGKCIQCGYCTNYASLEFHHRNPEEKDYDWNKLRLRSWVSIVQELDKCDLLCRNCHGEVHNPEMTTG